MLTIFVGKIKQHMYYWLWKFKTNTLINNHFIIKYLKNMVWSNDAVAVYFTTSLFFNVTLYTLNFKLGTLNLGTLLHFKLGTL